MQVKLSWESTADIAIEQVECANCGVLFWMSEHWVRSRRRSHQGFYCPNGHPLVFKGKSDVDELRDKLASTTAELDQANARSADLEKHAKQKDRKIARFQSTLSTKDKKSRKRGKLPSATT